MAVRPQGASQPLGKGRDGQEPVRPEHPLDEHQKTKTRFGLRKNLGTYRRMGDGFHIRKVPGLG